MANARLCSSLKSGEPVVANIYSYILHRKTPMDGTVVFVFPDRKEVCVSWMEGYKERYNNISFPDMLAAYDSDGEMMHFENIYGKSVLLMPE